MFLVPETAWSRQLMRFQSEQILGQDWSEVERLRPVVQDLAPVANTPSYFFVPLHGFKNGGGCPEQALQQAPSMRFVMRLFQCDASYREQCYLALGEMMAADPPPRGLALDLGCGSGDSALALRNCLPRKKKVIGVDLSRAMIKLARRRVPRDVRFHTCDAARLPLADNSVGVITSFAMFHEMPNTHAKRVLDECARVLRPGGYLVLWDQNQASIMRGLQDASDVPLEPFLTSYAQLNVTGELSKRGFCTIDAVADRFMARWLARTSSVASLPCDADSFGTRFP